MMTAQARSGRGTRQEAGSRGPAARGKAGKQAQQTAVYVYGIFPGDIKLESGVAGVGDPPGKVRIVACGDIAALVSDVSEPSSLGSPKDLTAHKAILDASAAEVPVLPMRFGALLSSDEDVANELLAANHDLFASALKELDGLVQCVVKGRYLGETILREVLSENREAVRLRDRIRAADPDSNHRARIRLGEIVDRAVATKRDMDTRTLVNRIASHCEASVLREPAHEWDTVNVALLVKTSESGQLQQAIDEVAHDWEGRVDLRLLGPMAAYDFVGTTAQEA